MKRRVALSEVKNFGPVTLAEFDAMGIRYLDEVDTLGFEDTCRRWVQYFPERLNANAFLGVICTLDRTVWTQATKAQRAAAHAMVKELRREYGLPPAKKAQRKARTRRIKTSVR